MNSYQTYFRKLVVKAKRDKPMAAFYAVCAILAAYPILFMLGLLIKYSVNVPFWDQWVYVDLMQKVHLGTLSFHDLWEQHNEHRILVPKLLTIGLGQLTGWNFRVPVLANWVFVAGSYTFLLMILKRTFADRRLFSLVAVAFAWLMFSPSQWINWIWGFQLAFFMSVFFAILIIWLITRPDILTSRLIFILTLLAAGAATYCNGNGLIIWPMGLGLLLWQRARRSLILQWLIVGVVFSGSYLYKFKRSPDSLPLLTVIKEPLAVLRYVLIYIGHTFATTANSALYVGGDLFIVFILSLLYLYKKQALSRVTEWVALAFFSLVTALLAAVSRLNFGVDHAFIANSYLTISLLFILATIVLVAYSYIVWFKDYNRKYLSSYVSGLLALGVLIALPLPAYFGSFSKGTFSLEDLSRHFDKELTCIYNVKTDQDDCLLSASPDKKAVFKDIEFLHAYGWDGFKK